MRNRSETRESKHIRLPFLFAIHPLKRKHNKSTLSTGRVAAGDTSKFANARSFLLMERNLNVEKATTLHPTNNLNTNSSDNSRSPVPFVRCPTQNKVSHAYPLDERFSTPFGHSTHSQTAQLGRPDQSGTDLLILACGHSPLRKQRAPRSVMAQRRRKPSAPTKIGWRIRRWRFSQADIPDRVSNVWSQSREEKKNSRAQRQKKPSKRKLQCCKNTALANMALFPCHFVRLFWASWKFCLLSSLLVAAVVKLTVHSVLGCFGRRWCSFLFWFHRLVPLT